MKATTVLSLSLPILAALLPEFVSAASGKRCSAPTGHRRHHAKHHKTTLKNKIGTTVTPASEKAKSQKPKTVGDNKKKGNATSSGSFGFKSSFIAKNGVVMGFLPDEGDAGGQSTLMTQLNAAYGGDKVAGIYGYYAQAHDGHFDGSQLLQRFDDIKASGAVFNPAVMPTNWVGLTDEDSSQATNIANVMKKFTDAGIEVWLRFAHEMNYYQTDGTYQGGVEDFQTGWKHVAAAVRKIAPKVKMHWTPNIASAEEYAKYWPRDESTVDLVGVDFYPHDASTSFAETMQEFHDTYAKDGRMMVVGETGLGVAASMDDRFKWLNSIYESKKTLKNLVGVAWFNFQKDNYDYRVVIPGSKPTMFSSLFALS